MPTKFTEALSIIGGENNSTEAQKVLGKLSKEEKTILAEQNDDINKELNNIDILKKLQNILSKMNDLISESSLENSETIEEGEGT